MACERVKTAQRGQGDLMEVEPRVIEGERAPPPAARPALTRAQGEELIERQRSVAVSAQKLELAGEGLHLHLVEDEYRDLVGRGARRPKKNSG